MDQYWNRICEAAQKLASYYNVMVPAGLLSAEGNVWVRDSSRRSALNEFMGSIGKPAYIPEMPLWVIAEQMDGFALKAMMPEETTMTSTAQIPEPEPEDEEDETEETGEVYERESELTEVKPTRRRRGRKQEDGS